VFVADADADGSGTYIDADSATPGNAHPLTAGLPSEWEIAKDVDGRGANRHKSPRARRNRAMTITATITRHAETGL
jgi:hypothetical protein